MSDSLEQRSDTLTLSEALDFLRRRRAVFVLTTIAILSAAVTIAYKLPPVYLSEATILIEQPAIPDDFVQSTIRTYVDERIQVVSQRVLSADNIHPIIDEFDLFVEERDAVSPETLVQYFRESAYLENRTADAFDPRRGRVSGSTFAFVVGYATSDPIEAQNVTDRLAALYLEENKRSRRDQAQETTTFLEQESERLGAEIAEIEERMAEFKNQYADAMPEQGILNTQTLDRRWRELENIDQELIGQRSMREQLRSQLRTINPYAIVYGNDGQAIGGTEDRLTLLRQEYLQLTGRYGAEHPDVVRVKREIEALSSGGMGGRASDLAMEIASLEQERGQLLERYSSEHPDVARLDRSIANLKAEAATVASSSSTAAPRPPTNPEYRQIQLQIMAAEDSLRIAQARRDQLQIDVNKLEKNIAIGPRVEQEWSGINRGYETVKSQYDAIEERITQARLSQRLETEDRGQKFTILERAFLPSDPIEPNRTAIIFLGVVLALGAGIGLAALVDSVDPTIRSVNDLRELLETNPIATIPIISAGKVRGRWRRKAA